MEVVSKIHVASLTAREQNALRLLLNNYMKIQMKILLNTLSKAPTDHEIDRKWRRLRQIIDHYESVTYNYPVRELVSKHKTKLMLLNLVTMRHIGEAIRIWSADPNENTLDQDDINTVGEHIEKLDKLFKMSLQFEYDAEDIKRVKGAT